MGWLIALAVLSGLAFLPLGFRAIYRDSGTGVWVLIGPLSFRVYPRKPKAPKPKEKQKKTAKKTNKSENKSTKGGSYRNFEPIVRTVLEFLGQFRKRIRVKNLTLKLILAGDDPSDLAVNYGRAWAILGNLIPQLERVFVIKKRNIEAECDFTADKTVIFARLDATITLGRTVHLFSLHGLKILKHLLKLKK